MTPKGGSTPHRTGPRAEDRDTVTVQEPPGPALPSKPSTISGGGRVGLGAIRNLRGLTEDQQSEHDESIKSCTVTPFQSCPREQPTSSSH